MLKILLVNPDFNNQHPPLGLGYLSSYLKKFLKTPLDIQLYDGIDLDGDIAVTVRDFKPDIIGVSVVTPTFKRALTLCQRIREESDVPIVAGGPHITALPDSILDTVIDVAVIGEGEDTFLELMQSFLLTKTIKNSNIKGILFVKEGAVTKTPPRPLIKDLANIPPPDRTIFRMRDYYLKPKRQAHGLYARGTSMMPSRGCPYGNCNFCSSILTWGNVPRLFPPQIVADEIESIIGEYNSKFFIFLDDNFTTSLAWLKSLQAILQERGLDKIIRFDCESIAAFLDTRRAETLKHMGCIRIEFGFESGCERVLHALKSGHSKILHNEKALDICKQHGIYTLGNAIFGYIDETPAEFEESVHWYLNHPIDYIAPHVYTPYPGTIGWNECIARGIIDPTKMNWENFLTSVSTDNFLANRQFFETNDFLSRYESVSAEFYHRNKTLIIEDGIGRLDKIKLHESYLRERKNLNLDRMTDGGKIEKNKPIGKLDHGFAKIYACVKKVRNFIHSDRKIWLLQNKLAPWLTPCRHKKELPTLSSASRSHPAWQGKPMLNKIRHRLLRLRFFPIPVRLPWGGWWLAWNDVMGANVRNGAGFEQGEHLFLQEFLQAGMTFLDIGSHQGFYTLLASKKLGPGGKVFAFEPSPREFARLKWNLRVNRNHNIQVENFALGSREEAVDLFLCMGMETGCNSLRPPAVADPVVKVRVPVKTLDGYLEQGKIDRVNFVKLDVEGAELDVLRGAQNLMLARFRPLFLCELADVRTEPWGYQSAEIYDLLLGNGYIWFSVRPNGMLVACPRKDHFHENLIAVPMEKKINVLKWLSGDSK